MAAIDSITIGFKKGFDVTYTDIDHCVAATQAFPHWTIWPEAKEGKQEVFFYPVSAIKCVRMVGDAGQDEDEGQAKLASVTDIFSTHGSDEAS